MMPPMQLQLHWRALRTNLPSGWMRAQKRLAWPTHTLWRRLDWITRSIIPVRMIWRFWARKQSKTRNLPRFAQPRVSVSHMAIQNICARSVTITAYYPPIPGALALKQASQKRAADAWFPQRDGMVWLWLPLRSMPQMIGMTTKNCSTTDFLLWKIWN